MLRWKGKLLVVIAPMQFTFNRFAWLAAQGASCDQRVLQKAEKPGKPGFSAFLLLGYNLFARRLGRRRFGYFRTIHQLDQRHRRIIADAETELQDAHVAAGTGFVTWSQFVE